jgi:hypothetical protein
LLNIAINLLNQQIIILSVPDAVPNYTTHHHQT